LGGGEAEVGGLLRIGVARITGGHHAAIGAKSYIVDLRFRG
jgi:hypothetical protein